MKDLRLTIKELERTSLYCFKEHRNKDYVYMVLYFSPDDYHTYVGFSTSMVGKTREKKITCHMGRFYINHAKQSLFIDSPAEVIEVSNTEYQKIYKDGKELEVFQASVLSMIYPVSSTINEK